MSSWDPILTFSNRLLDTTCSSSIVSGRLDEIETEILFLKNDILSVPRSDPRRALRVQQLARARFRRYVTATKCAVTSRLDA